MPRSARRSARETSESDPNEGFRTVCKCGAPDHPRKSDRCARGHLIPGNTTSLVVGHKTKEFWKLRAPERGRLQRALVEDAGFAFDDAPVALQLAADALAQATLIRDAAFEKLAESYGPLSASGKTRQVYSVWCNAFDRADRATRLLGLRRKAKAVPSLAEVLAEKDKR